MIGLCECGCGKETKLSRYTDAHNGYVKGMPMRFLKGHGGVRPPLERFWAKVNKTETCWLWKGHVDADDYGRINWFGKRILTHRLSWKIHNGAIPQGLCVLHRCDTPRCVRPDHLFIGTNVENTADKTRKGRAAKGLGHGLHKLTQENVQEIRKLKSEGWRSKDLTKRYGVTRAAIYSVIMGKTWKWLGAEQ